MPAASLTELQRQIAERERELQALRAELDARQSQFAELTRRKEALRDELRQVEAEIAALSAATPSTTEQPVPAAPAGGQPRLRDLIVAMLRESGAPMTARQLCEEAQRRGYEPTGRDPVQTIKSRLQDLREQGVVRKASGQPGYVLTSSANGAGEQRRKAGRPAATAAPRGGTKSARPKPTSKKGGGENAPAGGSAGGTRPGRRGGQPPLRVVLTGILKGSRKPLSGSELAERALAAGYKTKSDRFVDSVWAMLGQMKNVEHLPQRGYRLKRK